MSEMEIENVSKEITDVVNAGKMDVALSILNDEGTQKILLQGTEQFYERLFECATKTISNVVQSKCDMAVKIYAIVCKAEIEKQARELNSKDKALEQYISVANRISERLDYSNEKAVKNAILYLETVKMEIDKNISDKRPSILSKLLPLKK